MYDYSAFSYSAPHASYLAEAPWNRKFCKIIFSFLAFISVLLREIALPLYSAVISSDSMPAAYRHFQPVAASTRGSLSLRNRFQVSSIY